MLLIQALRPTQHSSPVERRWAKKAAAITMPNTAAAVVCCLLAEAIGSTRFPLFDRPPMLRYCKIALTSVTNFSGGIVRRQLISRFSEGALKKSRTIVRVQSWSNAPL